MSLFPHCNGHQSQVLTLPRPMLVCRASTIPISVASCLCVQNCSSAGIRCYPALAADACNMEGNRLSSGVIFVLILIFCRCCSPARMKFNCVHVLFPPIFISVLDAKVIGRSRRILGFSPIIIGRHVRNICMLYLEDISRN